MDVLTIVKDPSMPKQIAGFDVLAPIGKGGMSIVYRGRDPSGNLDVAIKLITREHSDAYDRRDRKNREQWPGYKYLKGITWEGEILANLNHPHIIHLYDYGKENGQYYLVMEYLPSRNLHDLNRSNSEMLRGRRLKIVYQFAHALQHVHRMGIIHRDVCPRNVLLDEQGRAKIIDFGLAIPNLDKLMDVFYRSGTPSYMAPEILRFNRHDFRTDVYAFGISMYEIFTGKPPLGGEENVRRAEKHLNVQIKPPREVNPSIPRELEVIILRAIEKDPAQRYASMSDLVGDLGRLIGINDGSETTRLLLEDNPRRLFDRVRDRCYLHYYVRSWITRSARGVAVTDNISAGGVAFRVRQAPPIGAILDLEIQPRAATNRISASGEVVHVGQPVEGGLVPVGVAFRKIAWRDRDRFQRYIEERKTADVPRFEY